MASSGYIDWHRLDRTRPWARIKDKQHTYVYAFWMVDYGHNANDRGVALLKTGTHPDWFIHADTADHVLGAFTSPRMVISPNFTQVFTNNLSSAPLLAAMLIGTTDAVYRDRSGQMWWAHTSDLNRKGKQLIKAMDRLYERPAVLVTFIDEATDEDGGPRGAV